MNFKCNILFHVSKVCKYWHWQMSNICNLYSQNSYQPSKHNISKDSWYRMVSENAHSKIRIWIQKYWHLSWWCQQLLFLFCCLELLAISLVKFPINIVKSNDDRSIWVMKNVNGWGFSRNDWHLLPSALQNCNSTDQDQNKTSKKGKLYSFLAIEYKF